MADMNELRRLLEQGVISEQDVADAMQQQPRNELAQMMTHGPGMPQPRFDIAPMEMNTMRAENGPNAGQVTPMNFTGGMPQQPQQKLGDRVEVVGRGMGRYSQDGRSVVFADGSTHDLHPQASAMAAKAAFERMKAEAALANQNAGTAKTLEEITSLRNSRSEKARERTEMGAAPQSFLEKKYGKPASGMRWTQEGEPEPIPGMAEPQKVTDAKDVLEILKIAEPLLEKSTGSYGGAALDKLGQVVGISTEGANAAAQLKTLQGTLISKMPKMTGPQSDKDVQLYREMAGQIGDPTIPAERKRAAMDTIRQINERHVGGEAQSSQPAAKTFQSMPAPQSYEGKRMQAPDGTIYKSDGKRWVRQ
jgi:hypothetical protein